MALRITPCCRDGIAIGGGTLQASEVGAQRFEVFEAHVAVVGQTSESRHDGPRGVIEQQRLVELRCRIRKQLLAIDGELPAIGILKRLVLRCDVGLGRIVLGTIRVDQGIRVLGRVCREHLWTYVVANRLQVID